MRCFLLIVLALWATPSISQAGIVTLQFEGEIQAGGEPYSGTGLFKFRITDSVGRLLWAHRLVPNKRPFQEEGHLELEVVDGRYSVNLADSDAGMPQLSTEYLRRMSDPHLEVWFSDGQGEFQPVGAYAVVVDPQFDIPANPLELRRQLVEERKQNKVLQQKLAVERINRQRAEAIAKKAQARPALKSAGNKAPSRLRVRTNTERPEVMGSQSAPLVIMEFTDLQCTVCKAFHDDAYQQIIETYVDSGQVLYINAHLPLPIHPDANRAAQAVSCAGEQGQFWAMRDLLFANQHDLSAPAIEGYARELGLDGQAFDECQKQPEIILEINQQLKLAASMGIKATPTFVIGTIRDGQVDGEIIVGSHPFDFFADRIEALLDQLHEGSGETAP